MNSAHDALEKVKDVLRDFLKDIEETQSIRKNMSAPQMALAFTVADRMPIFDASTFTPAPDSAWEKDDAYTWLYGATRYHPLMRRMGPSDGNGITYKGQPTVPGQTYPLDDDLIFWLVKALPSKEGST
jgi:hypothetical protein